MNKINYQKELDKVIEVLQRQGRVPRLLLHSCCAPCSSYVLEYLSRYFSITLFFYNPNIHPQSEYDRRLAEELRLCESLGVEAVACRYDPERFFEAARGLEGEKEGGARCLSCFRLRLLHTAELAASRGIDLLTSTLTVSPHKNAQLINSIGFETAQKYGVNYLPSDFKKRGGYQRSIVLSKEYGIYRQQYCGCVYSYVSAEEQRKNSAAKKEGGEE